MKLNLEFINIKIKLKVSEGMTRKGKGGEEEGNNQVNGSTSVFC
jgi:hypothetical protein